MSLPQSTDVSSSTLGMPGIETPLSHPLTAPPLRDVERYEKRSLPPVPLKRQSDVSAFSDEVDDALATPDPVVTPDEGSIYLMFCRESTSDQGDAEIVSPADKKTDKKQKKEDLRVNTAGIVRAPFSTAISPQPRSSIQKLHKISGVQNAPTYRETTPTGHNSEKKIHRLTGLGVPSELAEQQKQIRAEQKKQLYGEVSPLSNGSDHSYEGPRTAVSDMDSNAEAGREYSSEPNSGYFSFRHFHRRSTGSSAMPIPLRIVKPPRPSRSPERRLPVSPRHDANLPRSPLSPWIESEQASFKCGRDTPSDKSSPDLYHETAKQLAQEDARTAQQAKRDTARLIAAQQFLQGVRASSADNHRVVGTNQPPPPRQHQRHHSPDIRQTGSTDSQQPIWRPSNSQQETPRAVSASTFGHLQHRFKPPTSTSPVPSRDPELRSQFDFDSDDDDDNNTGTPETDGSIPISIASDISLTKGMAKFKEHTTRRRRRRSHSSSIIAKVFRRSSANSTPPPPHNTSVHNTPNQSTAASPIRQTHHPVHRHQQQHPSRTTPPSRSSPIPGFSPNLRAAPPPPSTTRQSPRPGTGTDPSPRSSPNPNQNKTMRPKTSMSALAAKTTDLATDFAAAAAGLIKNKRMSEEERRQQQIRSLKSSIRVLEDGTRVSAGSVEGASFGPGLASGSVTAGSGTGSGYGSVGSFGVGAGREPGAGPGAFRGRLGSAATPAHPPASSFWAGQPGDGSVWGKGVVQGPQLGTDRNPGRGSPRPGHEQGTGSNLGGSGRESPMPAGNAGNTSGTGSGTRTTPRQGVSSRGSPRPQPAGVVRGDSPRGSPRPRKKESGPSPRPSAEMGRDTRRGSQGVGLGLGVM